MLQKYEAGDRDAALPEAEIKETSRPLKKDRLAQKIRKAVFNKTVPQFFPLRYPHPGSGAEPAHRPCGVRCIP